MGIDIGMTIKAAGFLSEALKFFLRGPKIKAHSGFHILFVSPPGYSGNCGTDTSVSLDFQLQVINEGEETTFEYVRSQTFDSFGYPVGEPVLGHISATGFLPTPTNFLRKNESRFLSLHFGWREKNYIERGSVKIEIKPVGQKAIEVISDGGRITISNFKDWESPNPLLQAT